MRPGGNMTGNWKTESSQSQIDTESHWQANCRDQLSLKKLGAGGVNTNAVTSDISGRFKRRRLFYGFDLRSIFIHTRETHTRERVYVHTHTYTHELLLSLEAQYYKYEKHFPKGKHSEEQQPLDLTADGSLASTHASLGEGQVGARGPAFA